MDGKNKNDKINYEDEGVFYTPSKEAQNLDSFDNYASNKKEKKKNIKKLPPQKSKYQAFMALAIGSGIIVFIVVIMTVQNSFNSKNSQNNNNNLLSEETSDYYTATQEYEASSKAGEEYMGVIRTKSESFDALTIYNITKDENADYKLTGQTDMRDEYGKTLVAEEFSEGDLILFIYDAENNLTSVKKTDKGFSEKIENGFKINTDKMTLSANMKTYSYSEMTKFIYGNGEFDPTLLDPTIDIITISGYGDKIWSITLEKGHGTIEITKNNRIKNGILEIDTEIYKKLSDADSIKINEGVHKIVVKGSNIDPFTKDIAVMVNEKYPLDLNEIKIKTGKLTIQTNVEDFALYINGKLELSREPLKLEYGTYEIEIVKNGYITYTNKFTINSPEQTIKANLTKEIKMGTLTVNSNPSGANLIIDEVSAGTTPYSGNVTQGLHSITLKKDGYRDISISSINISDQEAIYNIDLQKEQ